MALAHVFQTYILSDTAHPLPFHLSDQCGFSSTQSSLPNPHETHSGATIQPVRTARENLICLSLNELPLYFGRICMLFFNDTISQKPLYSISFQTRPTQIPRAVKLHIWLLWDAQHPVACFTTSPSRLLTAASTGQKNLCIDHTEPKEALLTAILIVRSRLLPMTERSGPLPTYVLTILTPFHRPPPPPRRRIRLLRWSDLSTKWKSRSFSFPVCL